jgi:DNA/RNA endonuclease YhcR with UshA esterase domain
MTKRVKVPGMSLIAWIAFVICTGLVIFSVVHTKEYRILVLAIPMLAALLIIPMLLARMSRSAYSDATPHYERKAKFHHIANIDLSKVGEIVKVRGMVVKVSFKWLNRPHLSINDGTGTISAIFFTSLAESVEVGEQVEVLGTVMRGFPHRRTPVVSAISAKKLGVGD